MFLAFPLVVGCRPDQRSVWAGLVTAILIGSFVAPVQAQSEADNPEHRTVAVNMTQGACDIELMSVSAGEKVRFVLHNTSNLPRDFTVETALMQSGPSPETPKLGAAQSVEGEGGTLMGSDASEVVLIRPGETKEVIWAFPETKDIELFCNVPDHYEFGVIGTSKIPASAEKEVVRVSSEPLVKQKASLSDSELPQSGKLAGGPSGELTDDQDNRKKADGSAALRVKPVTATAALVVPPVRPQKKPAKRPALKLSKKPDPDVVLEFGDHDGPGWLVQVSAHRSATSAQSDWIRLVRRHGTVLGSREHLVVKADLGSRGVYYRLRVPGFATPEEARSLCLALKARGDTCFIVPPVRTSSGNAKREPEEISAEQSDAAAVPRRARPLASDLR